MEIETSIDANSVSMVMDERFDYEVMRGFRDAYRDITLPGMTYRVDFRHTRIMDSAALGMLLLLKEHADQHNGKVVLCNVLNSVAEVLKMSRFERIFDIEI